MIKIHCIYIYLVNKTKFFKKNQMIKTFLLKIRGKVQNVGFRYWFFQEAVNLNLNGYVKNLDNTNEIESLVQGVYYFRSVFGPLAQLVRALRS